MSYTLTPYVVDLDRLRAAVGSRSETLLTEIVEGAPDRFRDDTGDDEEISLRSALRHLIMGEPPVKESAHQYGYAVEQLCRHFGAEVGERDLWESIHWDVLEATGADELLTRTGSPVALPPIDSFPTIGHLEAGKIAEMVERLGGGHLMSAAPSGRKPRRSFRSWLLGLLFSRITRREPMSRDEVRECLSEFEGWLREAAEKRKSLVFFYY